MCKLTLSKKITLYKIQIEKLHGKPFFMVIRLLNIKQNKMIISLEYLFDLFFQRYMESVFEIEAYLASLPADTEIINIDGKNLTYIPSLSRFKNLKELDCSINQLTELPSLPENLRKLYCYNNKLSRLPKLNHLLEKIDCSDNSLGCLPSLNENLKELDCNDNCIIYLPPLNKNLELLDCSNNLLECLPTIPESLRQLYCSDNEIIELPCLPDNLIELTCSDNKLYYLPHLSENLVALVCSNNNLSYLPTLNVNLKILICNSNNLTELPPLPETLKRVSCSKNNISYLPILPETIESLHCIHNPIHTLIFSDFITMREMKRKIQILSNIKNLCYSLMFNHYSIKYRNQFRIWLWERVREPKIIKQYNPTIYLKEMYENCDVDIDALKDCDMFD